MWTLWLVSKVFHRLSLRNQSLVHSSPARHISGMKYKYSTARERSTGVMQGGVIGQLHFFRGNSENMSPWCSLCPTFSISLVLYLRHTAHNIDTHTETQKHRHIYTYNQLWKYFSNVKCPEATEAMQVSPEGSRSEEGSARYLLNWQTSLKSTGCLSAVKAASLHEYNPITQEVKGRNTPEAFCMHRQSY